MNMYSEMPKVNACVPNRCYLLRSALEEKKEGEDE
jgi:hypothetical protein